MSLLLVFPHDKLNLGHVLDFYRTTIEPEVRAFQAANRILMPDKEMKEKSVAAAN